MARPFHLLVALVLSWPAFAADYQIEANIRYGHYAETVLDILQARAPALEDRPGVILIHGGGWVEGDKEQMVATYALPFIEHGFVVANIEYRLAKAAPAPAAVNDVLQAAQWFASHAAEYKVDPKRILVAGSSAGGHLALMTGMVPASADLGPVTKIAAVIDFFGIADVADQLEGPNQRDYATAWIPDQPGRMDLARKLSPIHYVRKGLPPILAIQGDADPVVPYAQSVSLTKALKAAGDDAELITVPDGKHGFPPEEMEMLWPQVFRWLKKHKIAS
ncbi:MAG TPA: alpha/beta hydrolase [Bryobacteraceae bacterium]|nr:alpha/beta hydrolase [Bryobacteraceae bacterium]